MELKMIGDFAISKNNKLYKFVLNNLYECETFSTTCEDCAFSGKDLSKEVCFGYCNGRIFLKNTDIWDYENKKFKTDIKLVEEFEEKSKPTAATAVPEKITSDIIKPNHYKMTINGQIIEVMDILKAILTPDEMRGFNKGNIIKYILRERNKNGIADIKKCKQYAEFMLGDEE